MSRRLTLHSLRWLVLSCSVACMTPVLLAQEAAPPEPPAERDQERRSDARDDEGRDQDPRDQDERRPDPRRQEFDSRSPQERGRAERGDDRSRPDGQEAGRQQRRGSRLGLMFEEGDQLVIRDVEQESAAARAGFRPGDRIISVNGREVSGQRRFGAFLGSMSGRRVPVIIERNGRQYTIQLTPEQGADGPWLGIYLQDNEEGQEGAVVTHVYPASPAARAGLRTGDVIAAVEDQQVESPADLIAILDQFEPRERVNLQVRRGDQEIDATATLASRRDYFFQTSFDERDGEGRGQQFDENDPWANLPPFAMQLEHDRRVAEQHERIESEIRKLQEEVRALREAIERR